MDAANAWSQREGESDLWYQRFLLFCHAGPQRSVDGLYLDLIKVAQAQHAPDNWHEIAKENEWLQRAKAWDAHQHELWIKDQSYQLRTMQEQMLKLYQLLFNKLVIASRSLQTEDVKWTEISNSIKMISGELKSINWLNDSQIEEEGDQMPVIKLPDEGPWQA